MDYDNKGRFSLWKNTKMRPEKNDADYVGTYTDENGNEHWINAWGKKEGSSDKAPVLSGSIRPKQGNAQSKQDASPFDEF